MTYKSDNPANPLAGLTTEELLDIPTGPLGLKYSRKEYEAEIRRRLERLAKCESALKVAPHAKDCASHREDHLPGYIHYETDGDEPCPAYHFRRRPCNCYRAALEAR